MDSGTSIPDFACKRHPNEIIKRISVKKGLVYCLECIVECNPEDRKDLVSVDKFFEFLEGQFNKIIRLSDTPPDSVISFAKDYSLQLKELQLKIEEEKISALHNIDLIEEKMKAIFQQTRQDLSKKFDEQFDYIQSVFNIYLQNISYYFRPEGTSLWDKDSHLTKISRLQSADQLESYFSNTVSSMKHLQLDTGDLSKSSFDALQDLKIISKYLTDQKKIPTFEYKAKNVEDLMKEISSELIRIKNQFPPITPLNMTLPDLSWLQDKIDSNSQIVFIDYLNSYEEKINYFYDSVAGTVGLLVLDETGSIYAMFRKGQGFQIQNLRYEILNRVDESQMQKIDHWDVFAIDYRGNDNTKIHKGNGKWALVKQICVFQLKKEVYKELNNKSKLFNNQGVVLSSENKPNTKLFASTEGGFKQLHAKEQFFNNNTKPSTNQKTNLFNNLQEKNIFLNK